MIWSEIKQLWDVGLKEYISDMWNVVDFITNSLYVATIGLRTVAFCQVSSLAPPAGTAVCCQVNYLETGELSLQSQEREHWYCSLYPV